MCDAVEVRREMGCTRAEFIGWLPGATRNAPLQIEGDRVTVVIDGGLVQIFLEEKAPRRIGLIALPALGVTFCFRGLEKLARDDFLAYFDLYTRRGGG